MNLEITPLLIAALFWMGLFVAQIVLIIRPQASVVELKKAAYINIFAHVVFILMAIADYISMDWLKIFSLPMIILLVLTYIRILKRR